MDTTRIHDAMGDDRDDTAEAETCRICRTEAADSETLFHPCKCSGSIKYVHQECLMEWLSHSQKKHCELCKTPFRFTKLYSSSMPEAVPTHLLIRHVFLHVLKNLRTWLRFMLVVVVWLGCLPYAIRQVWRLLFWFSDGGWPIPTISPTATQTISNSSRAETAELIRQMLVQEASRATATSPASPLLASQTTSAHIVSTVGEMAKLIVTLAQPSKANSSDSLARGFLQSLVSASTMSQNQSYSDLADLSQTSSTSTLLSEVAFLKNLTRFSFVNQMVISVVEGYVITFLVVICFILIFLIREWVVQQQPGINIGAGFNADFAAVDHAHDQVPPRVNNAVNVRNVDRRVEDRVQRRLLHDPRPIEALGPVGHEIEGDEGTINRPLPVRDALSPAAEIQRMLVEEPRLTEEFIAVWRRAGGDPQEVLRILEDEDKDGQMRYWVNLQRRNLRFPPGPTDPNEMLPFGDELTHDDFAQASTVRNSSPSHHKTNTKDVPENWFDYDESTDYYDKTDPPDLPAAASLDKGKGRAQEEHHNPSPPTIFSSSSGTRQRAISNSPLPSASKSPLGHTGWSFNTIPDAAENMDMRFTLDHDRRIGRYDVPGTGGLPATGLSFDNTEPGPSFPGRSTADEHDDEDYHLERHPDLDFADLDSWTPHSRNHDSLMLQRLANEDHAFNLSISSSDSEDDEQGELVQPDHVELALPNNDGNMTESTPADAVAPIATRGILGNVADFFWGGVDGTAQDLPPAADDEHVVQDVAAEPPFVPVQQGEAVGDVAGEDDDAALNLDNGQIPAAAGLNVNDLDAMDDAEDFDGILDLIGMRGPIFSLAQNAIFSTFLLSLTVAFGIWIPYNIGRLTLLLIGHPETAFKLPLRFVFGCAAFIQDVAMSVIGTIIYILSKATMLSVALLGGSHVPAVTRIMSSIGNIGSLASHLSANAFERVADGILDTMIHIGDSDMFAFSAASHESLINLKSLATAAIVTTNGALSSFSINEEISIIAYLQQVIMALSVRSYHLLLTVPGILMKPETWVISLGIRERAEPLDLAMSVWSGMDRFWAIMTGYMTVCLLGTLYVQKGTPFSTGQVGREWEATIIDILNQAGGVFKVILIISIEMLVFPLYCGLLLDVALLPIFDNATIMSRILFTIRSPLTSIFVHWFVGTCYMFHFALFVSMCRKIMRKGVLYFIRDPDDPTFHPVRDVLERNVTTQLRKILFSALVYGALVLVCLGGVVWGLAYSLSGVLPIHWSSNEPVLEFPIDLLFYNFLMPLAVKVFKPSDALHIMYTWWFRKCARMLRLTWFMFDERKEDEEGHYLQWTWASINPLWDDKKSTGASEGGDTSNVTTSRPTSNFQRDGRYVRAPASDQVRIPKGDKIFLHVDENNKRLDDQQDYPTGIHGFEDSNYKLLYVPPWFRTRIFTFILSIWAFAAFTGVSTTIIPLVLGRFVFAKAIPPHVRKNDIYAFAIGVYILGSLLYAAIHLKTFYRYARRGISAAIARPNNMLQRVMAIVSQVARILWTYTACLIVLPTLFAAVVELYLIVPLHSYMALEERHVVHFVQSWTLGLLYVKLTTRFILWHEDSRQAISLKAITRNGYLNPDARLATRCFILPLGILLSTALVLPWWLARLSLATILKERPEVHVLAHRYAYPLSLCAVVVLFAFYSVWGMLKQWKLMIRDEVYLIGERLHNYGERKSSQAGMGSTTSNMRRLET